MNVAVLCRVTLAKGLRAGEYGAAMVLKGAGHNFGSRRDAAVDKDDNRHIAYQGVEPGDAGVLLG